MVGNTHALWGSAGDCDLGMHAVSENRVCLSLLLSFRFHKLLLSWHKEKDQSHNSTLKTMWSWFNKLRHHKCLLMCRVHNVPARYSPVKVTDAHTHKNMCSIITQDIKSKTTLTVTVVLLNLMILPVLCGLDNCPHPRDYVNGFSSSSKSKADAHTYPLSLLSLYCINPGQCVFSR